MAEVCKPELPFHQGGQATPALRLLSSIAHLGAQCLLAMCAHTGQQWEHHKHTLTAGQ